MSTVIALITNIAASVVDAVATYRCSKGRHVWQYAPADRINGRAFGPYRVCGRCETHIVLATEPPAGHPDTKSITFTGDETKLLAVLDESLSKETW